MKKLMVMVGATMLAVMSAKAEFFWSTWFRDDIADKDVSGCVLGLASEVKTVSGAEVDLCVSKAKVVKSGCQFAVGYCQTEKLRNGAQIAFFNRADSAALQFGLLCFNKTGFLPFFVFFNFDPAMFGGNK